MPPFSRLLLLQFRADPSASTGRRSPWWKPPQLLTPAGSTQTFLLFGAEESKLQNPYKTGVYDKRGISHPLCVRWMGLLQKTLYICVLKGVCILPLAIQREWEVEEKNFMVFPLLNLN